MDRKIDDMCRMLREIDETHQVDRITVVDQRIRTKWPLHGLGFQIGFPVLEQVDPLKY